MLIATRLDRATIMKDYCFAKGDFNNWAIWWEQIEFLEALLSLYTKE
jgi:hypothetical protein